MTYEHRMMRCRLDRTALIAGHRYRPGEPLRDEHEPTKDFEEVPGSAQVVAPVSVQAVAPSVVRPKRIAKPEIEE